MNGCAVLSGPCHTQFCRIKLQKFILRFAVSLKNQIQYVPFFGPSVIIDMLTFQHHIQRPKMFQQPPTACTILWHPCVFGQEPTLQVKYPWNTLTFLHLSHTRLTLLTIFTPPIVNGLTMHCLSLPSGFWSACDCWSEIPTIRYNSNSVFCHAFYEFLHSINASFNCLLSENPPSAPRHQFTCQGNCSHVHLNRLCFVIYPHIYVISSSSLLYFSFSIWSPSLPCTCLVVSRRLLCRSWSQWPVSSLKTVWRRWKYEPRVRPHQHCLCSLLCRHVSEAVCCWKSEGLGHRERRSQGKG